MTRRLAVALVAILLASTGLGAVDEGISTARNLYAAAEYEDALAMLDRLRAAAPKNDELRTIEQYRALCLLALGRRNDAELAIASLVKDQPSYRLAEADAAPRVRSAFTEVRRRMLPAIIEERYGAAKAAFDRKQFVAAEDGFKQVLTLLADQDLGPAAAQSPLSDFRTLAEGFRDLSAKAAPPPPPPPPAAPVAPPPLAPAPTPPVRGLIYGPDDAQVSPPITVRQALPPFTFRSSESPNQGTLEIVIGETGAVESAVIRSSVSPRYDALVVEAARGWRYKPATLRGTPVMYRKLIVIALKRAS
jgi:TonB family protein